MNNFVCANDLNISWKISNYVEELHKLGTKNAIETRKLGTKNVVVLKVNSNTYKKINATGENNNKIYGYNVCVDDISGLEDNKIYFELEEGNMINCMTCKHSTESIDGMCWDCLNHGEYPKWEQKDECLEVLNEDN